METATGFTVSPPTATRLNIGCGMHPLLNYCNIDDSPDAIADLLWSVPPIPYPDGSLDEIFAGHYLEHLTQDEADDFLIECHRCLRVGGKLGIVVPDTYEVMRRYVTRETARMEFPRGQWHDLTDLDEINYLILFSTVQPSNHKWAYDSTTLWRLLEHHHFRVTGEINRWLDPRVSVGAWYQMGLDSVKE